MTTTRARSFAAALLSTTLFFSACLPTIKFSPPSPEVDSASTAVPALTAESGPVDPAGADLDAPLPPGDPARGKRLFFGEENGKYPCSACHSLVKDQVLVGPSLYGIGAAAAARVAGYSAERFIHESIVLPDAHVPEGFARPSIMPGTFGQQMSKQDLADLIAFLTAQE
jgi:cytochrome c2